MFRTLFKNRILIFLILLLALLSINFIIRGKVLPSTQVDDLWFFSGIFMVLFSVLFIEPYYSSPKNVVTNVIPLILVFLSVYEDFLYREIWWLAVVSMLLILVFAVVSILLNDENKSDQYLGNVISNSIKNCVVLIGKGPTIYSAAFFLLVFLNIKMNGVNQLTSIYFVSLMAIWGVIMTIDPKELNNLFKFKKHKKEDNEIGTVFGVQSKKMFLVRLYEDRCKSIKKFDLVKYKYSMQDSNEFIMTGIVFDTYLLNQEKWAKVLQLGRIEERKKSNENNIVFKVTDSSERSTLLEELNVQNFVGVVCSGSEIGKIHFEYSKKEDDLQEGDLLELLVGKKRLFYQVVEGVAQDEHLEGRNETGFIKGTAIQLGEWDNEKLAFQKFGWVPQINTPIFKADTSDIEPPTLTHPYFEIGRIPGTTLPSVLDLNEAISHHIALLGVTGSGKSFLARKIITQLQKDTKVICVDFTGEWKAKLTQLKPVDLIDSSGLPELEKMIAQKETELQARNTDKSAVLKLKQGINEKLKNHVKAFIESKSTVALFELPELSNTSFVLEFTQLFLEAVFSYAKANSGQKICIVLEEAHTIVPETNFLGDLGDYGSSKALVSKMSQIALQGRKYGVGLLVIAQRTANVSKTVLTQCNTVVCFQAFDETSFTFLGNYIGHDLVKALPNLKRYHAIITGKAVRSNLPMIIDLKE